MIIITNNFVTNAVLGVKNSGVLLETRLREFNRIAVDVGGGKDCFFRAVSHQLYGIPNHFHVRSLSFHKINTKLLQRTYLALLLSDTNRRFSPTSLNSPWSKLLNLSALH